MYENMRRKWIANLFICHYPSSNDCNFNITETKGKSIFKFSMCKSRLVLQPGSVVTGTIDYRVRTDLTSRDRRFLGNRVSGSPGRIYCSHRNWIAPSSSSISSRSFQFGYTCSSNFYDFSNPSLSLQQ